MLSPNRQFRFPFTPLARTLAVIVMVGSAGLLLGSQTTSVSRAQGPDPVALAEAIRAQQVLVEEHPADPALLSDLGNLLALAGRREEALAAYRSALELTESDAALMYNLALLLGEMGENREALEMHRRVAKLDPQNAWNLYQLGRFEAAAGKREAAVEAYSRAFALAPELTFPDVNPHLLENELMTAALLRIDSLPPTFRESPPRSYRDSGRIAGLLIPPPPPQPQPEAPPAAEETPSPASPTTMAPRLEDAPVESAPPPPGRPEGAAGRSLEDEEETPGESRSRRTLTVDDLDSTRVRNQAAGEAEAPGAGVAPTGRPVRTRPIPRTNTDPRTLPTPPQAEPQAPPTGGFQPARRSSAQLDVELLPPRSQPAPGR